MSASSDRIGPVGRTARLGVGLAFVALALFWREPDWADPVIGLIAMPILVIAIASVRARRGPEPLRATGPVGHALNTAVFLPLFFLPATAGAAFLFYGVSMLVAAVRRYGGCEVTAISNAVLRRDDQVGCVLFAPIDAVESHTRRAYESAVRGA